MATFADWVSAMVTVNRKSLPGYRSTVRSTVDLWVAVLVFPPVPLMPDLVYQYIEYSCTRILDLQYSTVVLGSYTAVQHRSYCITVLAVRILLYELYSTVLYCTTSMDGAKAEFCFCAMVL